MPLRDNLPTDRFPLVTVLLIAANVVAWIALHETGIVPLLLVALLLWWFGPSVEDAMSPPRFALFCALGGAAAIGLQERLDPGSASVAIAAAGVVAALIGGHLLLYPRARFLTVVPIPLVVSLVELPAPLLAALWLVLVGLLGAGLFGTFAGADGLDAAIAQLGGLAIGLLTIKLFAQRRKQVPARSASALST